MNHVVIVTDAWHPQVNGVVRTLTRMTMELPKFGVRVTMLTPDGFRSIPCPGYSEIRLAFATSRAVGRTISASGADHVHIATEGPIGIAARRWCLRSGRRFTTSFHTRFPEYLAARFPIPPSLVYRALRRFHNAGAGCMVATPTLERELAERGFQRLMRWTRGVDAELFHPRPDAPPLDLPRPIFLNVGRVALEKNIGAFLCLDLPGSKVVVGDGPALAALKAAYPEAHFLGARFGEELAQIYAVADVFVFPSRTDTFGIVLLEALASGLPVAAYPVTGPADVVGSSGIGVLDEDLGRAARAALLIPRERCRTYALAHGWRDSARQFLDNILAVQVPPAKAA